MSSSASGNFTLLSSTSSSSASSVGARPIPGNVLQRAQVSGPRAVLQQRAHEAAEAARDAAAHADALNNAHDVIEAKHHKMFLQKAFGINPDA